MTTSDEATRRKRLKAAFRMPSAQTMMSRKSSITNAIVGSVLPVIRPSIDEVEQALTILGMDPYDVRCAYCGDEMSEWDHLRPLVLNRRPTGFISEIANLVPSCGKCNQSKRNQPWRTWMQSGTDRSPSGRQIADLDQRIARLEAYECWRAPTIIDFESLVGRDVWDQYWVRCEAVIEDMKPFWNSDWLNVRVRVECDGRNDHGNTYSAFVGDERIGSIKKGEAVVERRPKGSRVVAARRHSLRWFGHSSVEKGVNAAQFPQETIGGAARLLAESYARANTVDNGAHSPQPAGRAGGKRK